MGLNAETEPSFWDHVYGDVADYYFFILDAKFDRADSKITLALDEKGKIQGTLLIYRNLLAQLRGSNEAIESLLTELDLNRVMVTTPLAYAPLRLPDRYRIVEVKGLTLMTLHKGEATPHVRHDLVRLSESDADDIAALMRTCNFGWWGEISAQQIVEGMKQRFWLGVKQDGRLVSIGGGRADSWAGIVNTVATLEDFRNRGCATSIVSALVQEILEKTGLALINVESRNAPAVRAYMKVGFRPYRYYSVAKAEKALYIGGNF